MIILSIGNFGTGWDDSICDEEHIAKALEELGHEVGKVDRGMPIFTDGGQWDFSLIAQYDGYSPELVASLPKPLIYWAFDHQADGQEWHERLVKEADLYLSKRIADSKYPNWQWLSQDFAPSFLSPLLGAPKDIDVLFTGSYLDWAKERNETIRAVNDNFNLVIHSVNAWPEEWNLNIQPPVMDHQLPGLYAKAKCILSIDHTLEAGYWSDRNAQIIACGRKPLFRYVPLSEVRFGDRVDYFNSIEQCLKKVQQHIDNPQYEMRGEGLFVKDRVKDLLRIYENTLI